MSVTQDEFRAALSRFPSGVTVVTTCDRSGKLYGITVSAFCSVSLEPPLILVCIETTTSSHRAVSETGMFVVNILSSGQQDISERFASFNDDKFSGLEYRENANGLPLLDGVAVTLECKLFATHEAGDHSVFVGLVDEVRIHDLEPLVYFHGEYFRIDQ